MNSKPGKEINKITPETKLSTESTGKPGSRYAKKEWHSGKPVRKPQTSGNQGKSFRNNISWYTPAGSVAMNVANIPFGNKLGYPQYLRVFTGGSTNYTDYKFHISGVMTMEVLPTIGAMSADASEGANITTPINVAARSLYAYIRRDQTGSAPYDSTDLMIYLLTVGQAYAYLEWLKTNYRLAKNYSVYNAYWPEAVLSARSVDTANIQQNAANFLADINNFARKLSSLVLPNTLSLVAKWVSMNHYIYCDNENIEKAQIYQFTQRFWLRRTFASTKLATKNGFELSGPFLQDGNHELSTVKDMMEFGNSLLEGLYGDESAGNISGAILRAYTESGIWRPVELTPDEMQLPEYNKDMLNVIHNLNISQFGRLINAKMGSEVKPIPYVEEVIPTSTNSPYLRYASFKFDTPSLTQCHGVGDAWLDIDSMSPTQEQVFECTRLQCLEQPMTDYIKLVSCDTMIVSAINISDPFPSTEFQVIKENAELYETRMLALTTHFDYLPLATKVGGANAGIVGDIYNIAIVPQLTHYNMNLQCIQTEFGIPSLGNVTTSVVQGK